MSGEHITRVSPPGQAWLMAMEELRLHAYLDKVGVYTIGYGTTRYPNGRRVAPGDSIVETYARAIFVANLAHYASAVDALTHDELLPHEFDALTSFAYNVGVGGYQASTLARFVNQRRSEPEIRAQFMRWIKGDADPNAPGLEVIPGLVARRICDADAYAGEGYHLQGDRDVVTRRDAFLRRMRA